MSVHDLWFEKFMILSLDNFDGGYRDKLLLCLFSTLKKYLFLIGQYNPDKSNLFISVTKKKKWVS